MSEDPKPKPLAEMAEAALRSTLHNWDDLHAAEQLEAAQAAETMTRVLEVLDRRREPEPDFEATLTAAESANLLPPGLK